MDQASCLINTILQSLRNNLDLNQIGKVLGLTGCIQDYLNLNELIITDTELKLIAVAAIMADSNKPNTRYSTLFTSISSLLHLSKKF